jgi:hypothetical protein
MPIPYVNNATCEPVAKDLLIKMFKGTLIHRVIVIVAIAINSLIVTSCSTATKTIGFSCQERQVEIYVDDEYLGRDLVYYTIPKSCEYIEVSCRENGIEVYHKRVYTKGRHATLIELQIPKNYRYSSKPY